ncbi:MAG: biotin/lipoyl-containing protein, partial [Polymorphobacter sp.]
MMPEIKLPAMSPTMEEGTLAKWLVKEGDAIRAGDVLAEIETDKATMELEADEPGTMGRIMVPAGSEGVKVGTVIAIIAGENDVPAAPAAPSLPAPTAAPAAAAPAPVPAPVPAKPAPVAAERPPVAPSTAGGAVKRTTVREALRDAMAEEMRSTDEVFVMGEEVAEYQGAYKVTQGLLEEFGPRRVID